MINLCQSPNFINQTMNIYLLRTTSSIKSLFIIYIICISLSCRLIEANSTVTPGDPTKMQCDTTISNLCPSPLECKQTTQKCGCLGNGIYSLSRAACKIAAGGIGCTKSGDCTDGGHCYHPGRPCHRCHNFYHYNPKPNQCHCCSGDLYGNGLGVCPLSDCNNNANVRSSHSGSDFSNINTMFKILKRWTACLPTIITFLISSYIIQ